MRRLKTDKKIQWHVMARGARRLDLFRVADDYQKFLSLLRDAVDMSGALLWGYILMSNHYHLVIQATSDELTACMTRLNRLYSVYHNERYGLVGHCFDGRYKRYPQASIMVLLRTLAYVFLNPVTAGICGKPEDYPWSSVRDYLGLEGSPLKVNASLLMRQVDEDPAIAWQKFHRAMEREARRLAAKSKTVVDKLTRSQVHAMHFEWLVEHAQEQTNLGGQDPILVAIYWARQCGISAKSMSMVLEGRSPDALRAALYRFRSKCGEDPDLTSRFPLP